MGGIIGERMAGRDSQTRGSLTNLSEVLAGMGEKLELKGKSELPHMQSTQLQSCRES